MISKGPLSRRRFLGLAAGTGVVLYGAAAAGLAAQAPQSAGEVAGHEDEGVSPAEDLMRAPGVLETSW